MSDKTETECSMVERVAKSIAEGGGSNWDDCLKAPGQKMAGMYRGMARAAIEAMREPTKGMWKAVDGFPSDSEIEAAWVTMIDAALNEQPSTIPR